YIAFPVAALSPDVNDSRRTMLEGVQEDIGTQGGDDLRWWGSHLTFERGGKTQVVRGAIVVFHHIMEHVVPAVAGGVHMRVDKAGRHQLTACREARVDRVCIGTASVHNAIVLVDDAPVFIYLMTGAVKSHHPAAFDKRFHTPPWAADWRGCLLLGLLPKADRSRSHERRYAVVLYGSDCTRAPGGSQHWRSGQVELSFTSGHFTLQLLEECLD